MLIVAREVGQAVMIGDDWVVTVAEFLLPEHAVKIVARRRQVGRPESEEVVTATLAIDDMIRLGDAIEVHLVDLRGDKSRLGIIAPKTCCVHRHEVYEAIRRENRAARAVSRKS